MITSLRIAHFKAAASVTVPLGPITVLIGPNDSGKSTILQALMALSRAADGAMLTVDKLLDCPPMIATTNHASDLHIQFVTEGTCSHGPNQGAYRYTLTISNGVLNFLEEEASWDQQVLLSARLGGTRIIHPRSERNEHWHGQYTVLSEIAREGSAIRDDTQAMAQAIAKDLEAMLLRLDPRAITRPSALNAPLLPDGSGLVGIVDDLLTSGVGDDKIARANEAIRTLSPHVKGVAAKLHTGGGKELHFALRSGAVVPASQMSDGVVLATALVLITLGVGAKRLLIEEPEHGLHPRQLGIVADTVRSIAREHGTQVVLTTHSPLLLNHFGAEETLLVTRTQAEGVAVRPMSETRGFEELAPEMSLGELWYNVGDTDLAQPS